MGCTSLPRCAESRGAEQLVRGDLPGSETPIVLRERGREARARCKAGMCELARRSSSPELTFTARAGGAVALRAEMMSERVSSCYRFFVVAI